MHIAVCDTLSALYRARPASVLYHPLDNPLQTAVLNLFVCKKWRFPNLVVGAITRESVRKALVNGIMADQVRLGILFECPLQWGLELITRLRPEGDINNHSAHQIISYLTTYAHPQMRKNVIYIRRRGGHR